jgi:protein arginine kinase
MARESLFRSLNSKWITETGPEPDVVLTSRVRLARNLRGYPFPHLLDADGAQKMLRQVRNLLTLGTSRGDLGNLELLPLADIDRLDRQVLIEKHLISPDFARSSHPGAALLVSDDEAISIMLNEEDHLRIQCLFPGFQLEECWRRTSQVDDLLESKLEYAFDAKRGYLTACPTNLGTGLRASVMVHLPGLVMTQQIGKVLAAIAQVGLVVRGLYGEGTEAVGNLFQISNQITLGPSEEEILQNLGAVIRQIVEQERAAQQALLKANRWAVEDKVCRAYGILTNARLLTSQEAMRLLSDVRLGHELGILDEVSYRTQNELLVLTQPAMMQRFADEKMQEETRDYRRAAIVRQRLTTKEGEK